MGDRIAPQTTEFRDGEVIVNYAERKEEWSFAKGPSMGKSMYLMHIGGKLTDASLSIEHMRRESYYGSDLKIEQTLGATLWAAVLLCALWSYQKILKLALSGAALSALTMIFPIIGSEKSRMRLHRESSLPTVQVGRIL